jgi:hypothetical protein
MLYSVKRLTPSDLTFFEDKFRQSNVGNQKAINLNRKVFIDLLYPNASALAAGLALQFPCELKIFGPNAINTPNSVMRKIIAAGGTQKNWRLNGETVHAPSDQPFPDRYQSLESGDLVVFGFTGSEVPKEAVMVLVSGTASLDRNVYSTLNTLLGASSMMALSETELMTVVDMSQADHPIRELLDPELDEALIDASLGTSSAAEKLRSRGIRRTTHKALAEARAKAERVGRDGEALVNGRLKGLLNSGEIAGFVWEAETNATHPFDFTIEWSAGNLSSVEVKSTEGNHERNLIFSQAEIEYAASTPTLEIWRLSNMRDGRAEARISTNLQQIAQRLTEAKNLIAGVVPTGWTLPVASLAPWGDPFIISSEDDPDE